MQVTTDIVENKISMILKMIRRFNAGILKFVMGIRLRPFGATLLGGFAGLSLTTNIIPSAMEFTGNMDSFSARWGLGGYAVYSVLAWAVGGWAVQKTGSKQLGAIILGFVGLGTGLLFTTAGIGTEVNILLTGGGAAMFYGAIGGLIIGDALRNPPAENAPGQEVSRKSKNKSDFRLFRFFK